MAALKITSNDHWAFLEEMEAPMWVDLDAEAKSGYNDTAGSWFDTAHMFHQCSSRQLKAVFSHSGESSGLSDLESMGSSSPKLPSSVSRSRGKEYMRKKWRGGDFLSNKQHPVMGLNGTGLNSRSGVELQHKLSFVNPQGTSHLKNSLGSERVAVGNARQKDAKRVPGERVVNRGFNSMVDKRTDSNTSTITSDSNLQPQRKEIEMSSHTFGGSSGFLSALRASNRKACATRPASRMESVGNGKELRDRKSSAGKSSVGSSSSLSLGSTLSKGKCPDGTNAARVTEAATNNITKSNTSKASHGPQKDGICEAIRGTNGMVSKSACPDLVKSKVQPRAKALTSQRVNEQVSVGAAAVKVVRVVAPSRQVIAGKENETGSITLSQKVRGGKISTQTMPRSQREVKINLSHKADRPGLAGQKGKVDGGPSRVKHSRDATKRPHFR